MSGGRRRKTEEDDMLIGAHHHHHPDWIEDMEALAFAVGEKLRKVTTSAQFGLLEQRVKVLEDARVRHESLTSLSPSAFKVKKALPISIISNGDDFVATFFDAKISATGDTAAEAMWNIKDILILKFTRLLELSAAGAMGSFLKKQLAVLSEFIEA